MKAPLVIFIAAFTMTFESLAQSDIQQTTLEYYLRGQVFRKITQSLDSGNSVATDTIRYRQTLVRLMNYTTKEESEVYTDENGSYEFASVPKGLYILSVDDPVIGKKSVFVNVRYENRNSVVKPLVLDREAGTLKVQPKIRSFAKY